MIKKYSMATDANLRISEHFTVREFACRDGADAVLIDQALVDYLEQIRLFFQRPIFISSGYRTPSYNTRINGAKNSNHIKGLAADFDVGSGKDLIDARIVAMYAETLFPRPGGLGVYQYADGRSWVHLDNGDPGLYWYSVKSGAPYAYRSTWLTLQKMRLLPFIPVFEVEVMQRLLIKCGFNPGKADGKFGLKTDKAVIAFQQHAGLSVDGICGKATWGKLFADIESWGE